VLRVQASNETLEGSGSKDLVGVVGYSLYHYLGAEAHHDLCFIQQPDRNTENDISIRDCCRYFRRNTRDPVFLLSGDVNLSIRGESDRGLLMWRSHGPGVLMLIIGVTNLGVPHRHSDAGAKKGLVKPSHRQQYLWV